MTIISVIQHTQNRFWFKLDLVKNSLIVDGQFAVRKGCVTIKLFSRYVTLV